MRSLHLPTKPRNTHTICACLLVAILALTYEREATVSLGHPIASQPSNRVLLTSLELLSLSALTQQHCRLVKAT